MTIFNYINMLAIASSFVGFSIGYILAKLGSNDNDTYGYIISAFVLLTGAITAVVAMFNITAFIYGQG